MIWSVPKMWEDGDVWILGGGPSVTKQFNIPDKVVQSVMEGTSPLSIYSPYMSALHDKHVIGINISFMIGDWIDMMFFGDEKFYTIYKEHLAMFPGLKVSCHVNMKSVPWIKYLEKDGRKAQGISPKPNAVGWNNNSGAAAISVAANAGAKRIMLLGFDMCKDEKNRKHWHNVYASIETRQIIKARNINRVAPLPFERHLRGFPAIARDAKARGIEILNVSPDSKITVFPKVSVKDILK
jgi:hypothetical protein